MQIRRHCWYKILAWSQSQHKLRLSIRKVDDCAMTANMAKFGLCPKHVSRLSICRKTSSTRNDSMEEPSMEIRTCNMCEQEILASYIKSVGRSAQMAH